MFLFSAFSVANEVSSFLSGAYKSCTYEYGSNDILKTTFL